MELERAIRRRRMVRRFDPEVPVPASVLRELVALAIRAPSAGFSQGWDFVALTDSVARERFWNASTPATSTTTTTPQKSEPSDGRSGAWLEGVRDAPALLVCVANPTAYLDRYAAPDKGWSDRSLERWPVPYWDTDTAMAAMLILLGATDRGLGSLFFGIPGPSHDRVKESLAIPADRRLVGVIALGQERERVRSPSLRRGRRPVEDVLHWGVFGASDDGGQTD